MSQSFTLVDPRAAVDLQTYLQRAARVEDGSTRLIADGGVLAAYTAILYPRGMLDRTPTVLGLRTFATAPDAAFDVVVPVRSLLDRLARVAGQAGPSDAEADTPGVEVRLPLEVGSVTWAGISPPRGGWRPVGEVEPGALETAARSGIDEVGEAVPGKLGEQLVQHVRSEVWGRGVEGAEFLPAGAGFAAFSLGFLGAEPVRVFETGPWTRLTTDRGHILVRRPNWTLKP